MHSKRSSRIVWYGFLSFLLVGLLAYTKLAASAERNDVEEARQRALEAGSYSFTADIAQTLLPRAAPETIGQSDQRIDWRVEGEVRLPDYSRTQLQVEGGQGETPPVTIVQSGDESYIQVGDKLQPLDSSARAVGGMASQDFLGYLDTATNVHPIEPEWAGGEQFSRYTFDIDANKFTENARAAVAQQLQGQLPAGTEITIPEYLRNMTGSGELWIDSAGLPRRQVLDLDMPAASEFYDAQMHIIVDFREFGAGSHQLSAVSGQLSSVAGRLSSVILQPSSLILYFACLVLAALILTYRRYSRHIYAAVAIFLIISFVFSPLLESIQLVRFREQQAKAAAADPIAEALGLETTTDEQLSTGNRQPPTANRQPSTLCGSGSPGVDSDFDGLNDQTEYCLGTDLYYGDSDRDMITDTVEVEGFDFAGKHWSTDPFKVDSNDDGMADFNEWPNPVGEAPGWDPDNDDIPNPWDDDNDDDLVPDSLDLSPYARTAYTSTFSLDSQAGGFDGYRYVEVQIQPKNQDSLRFSTSYLDWPHDTKGQLQDLNDSTDDIRLQPMLKVRTDQAPEEDLAEKYGVSAFTENGDQYLFAPLMPVSSGGQYVAFYAKIPYSPDTPDIHWEAASLAWVVQMSVDESVGGQTVSNIQPIQVYAGESFRVTGLEILMSKDYQSAILGTPEIPDDDAQLFNLVFGLSATYLTNQNPDLQAIYDRFTNPNTDPVEKWGVTTPVAVDLPPAYAHMDAGIADLSARLLAFLDGNAYSQAVTPTLLLATQEQIGQYNLSDDGVFEPSNAFEASLANIPMSLQRSLKQAIFAYQDGAWQGLTTEELLEKVSTRYADLSAILADLQTQYPDLTENDLRATIYMFYMTWGIGITQILSLGGLGLAPQGRLDQEVYNRFNQPGAGNLPAYLIEAAQLGQPGGGLRLGDPTGNWSYLRGRDALGEATGLTASHIDFYNFDFTVSAELKYIGKAFVRVFKTALSVITAAQCIQWAIKGQYIGITGWTKLSQNFGFFTRMKINIRILGVIGAVVSVIMIWTQFGLTTDFSNPLEWRLAVASAVAATVFTIVLFLLSLIPFVAILVAVFAIIDLILFFVIDFSLSGWIIEHIAPLFYSANTLTELDSADFINSQSGLVNEGLGVTPGNRFRVSDLFWGKIILTGDGDFSDLQNSSVYGQFEGAMPGGAAVNQNDPACTAAGSATYSNYRICSNKVAVEYRLDAALRDTAMTLMSKIHADTRYEDCTLYGLICWGSNSTSTDLPDDLQESDRWAPSTFYLDVLPTTMVGLWNWNAAPVVSGHIFNPDRDGDGLSNTKETQLGTGADNWDSDSDGLSDLFEDQQRAALGTNPLDPDSDDDTLKDGFEYRLSTRINQADTDGDGLTDAEEVNHPLVDGSWVGGWLVTLPDTSLSIRVFSDPKNPDTDGDGLDDVSERAAGTSPFAFNDVPHLTLEAAPFAYSPNADGGVYVENGDTVTFIVTLASTGPHPITSTLSLCLPNFLTDIQAGTLQGDRIPPNNSSLSTCNLQLSTPLAWDFSGPYTLQLWETVSATITATVDPALPASIVADALASLPYPIGGEVSDVASRVKIAADVDNPQVTLLDPLDGAYLGGGITTYVIGGSASDETSWVTRVDIDLPAGGGTVTAEGTSPWAYAWELPEDGEYVLQAQAYDYLGRVSAPDAVNVTVDNTPPVVTFDLADGTFVTGEPGNAGVITVTLTGSASDNLSGVTRVQVSADGKPWREVQLSGGDWLDYWTLPSSESAQGEHTVAVRAVDRAGNISESLSRTIIVDVVPPTDELTNRTFLNDPPHIITGQPVELYGVVNDVGRMPGPSRPDELAGVLDSLTSATIWLGLDSAAENDAGVHAAWIGDFNADRLADLAVGLPAATGGDGKVVIVYGRAGGWPVPADLKLLSDSLSSFVGLPGAMLGAQIAPAGDVNGDGYDDLLIGDAANNRAFVIFGRPNPTGQEVLLDGNQPAAWSVINLTGLGDLSGLEAAGDVNGDGYADLLVGVAGADRIYLLLGQPGAWTETVAMNTRYAAQVNANPMGAALTGVGDVDGDQYDDFVISQAGTLYLYRGSAFFSAYAKRSLELSDADATFASADSAPQVVALGNVNGDNLADFVFSNGDTPRLVFGDAELDWSTHDFSGLSPAASGFLAAAGDVDADGHADVLIGNADEDAYLFLASNLSSVATTLTGVESAASAPYAAGADLNSDGSSDLLLIPTAAAAAGLGMYREAYGDLPFVDPNSLPVANQGAGDRGSGVNPLSLNPLSPGSVLTVDDDGCPGCYTTLQSAVDAASSGDTILVSPGVYAPFLVSGKNDLTIQGYHPDAVFVDGGGSAYAVKIQNAAGISIEQMTLRDAVNAVELDHAGVGGYITPTLVTQLESLLVYDFATHAVYMDRTSTVAPNQCTLVGGDNHIEVYGPADPAFDNAWSTLSTDSRAATDEGGGVLAADGKVFVLPGNGSSDLYEYDPATDVWTDPWDLAPLPAALVPGSALTNDGGNLFALIAPQWESFEGGVNAQVNDLAFDPNGQLYVGGSFSQADGLAANNVAVWDGSSWSALGSGVNGGVYAMAVNPSNGWLYVAGGFTHAGGIYSENVACWNGSSWSAMSAFPGIGTVPYFRDMAVDTNGNVYVTYWANGFGDRLAKWNGSSWTTMLSGVYITSMDADDLGNVYMGGSFTNLGGVTGATNVAMWNGSSWSALGSGVGSTVYSLDYDEGYVYVSSSGVQNYVARWDVDAGTWSSLGTFWMDDVPAEIVADGNDVFAWDTYDEISTYLVHWDGSNWTDLTGGTADERIGALAVWDSIVYAGGLFTQIGGDTVNHVTRYRHPLSQYNIAADEWTDLTNYPRDGAAIARDRGNTLYILAGNNSALFYRYGLDNGYWETLANLPASAGEGAALVFAQDIFYALRGDSTDEFYRYLSGSNTWEALAPMPYVASTGASLAWDGRDWIYAIPGGNGKQFLRYNIPSDQWQVLGDGSSATPDDDDLAFGALGGAGLALDGHDLYVVTGGGVAQLEDFSPVALYPQRLTLDQVAFVVDDTAANGSWLNFDLPPDDFYFTGSGSASVGGSGTDWTPDIRLAGGEILSHAQAAFLDPVHDSYRLTAGSLLAAGYHAYRPDAIVAPSGEEFTDIQTAILSGANRVFIRAGVYPQSFYLLSSVSVIGAGADTTIIEPPPSFTGALVAAEGVAGAGLSRVTLSGEGFGGDGLRVEDGAQSVAFFRSIVRGAANGIVVNGEDTDLEVFNTTLVENTNGVNTGSCAPLDVRNTIIAFNSGTGLLMQAGSCSPVRLHTYNLFWNNGADLSPALPGPGELFLDPLFADRYSHNYHLSDNSPAIDSGNPTDPYPPGAGKRVDIGYLEYSRAAFYADDDYCETCINDGLTWQVDAFDVIQDALDAATDYVRTLTNSCNLQPATCNLQTFVGVGPGSYAENLRVPSHVHLIGSGADETTVDGSGGSPVTLLGVIEAQVSDFTLTGTAGSAAAVYVAGASNSVAITHNVIRGNAFGVRFEGRSSGLVSFNTIVNNTQAGVLSGLTQQNASWKLDESAGATSFADASGNGHTATCSGATCPTAGEGGRNGSALHFDGSDDYLSVANQANLNPTNLTVAAWINADTWAAQRWIGTIVGKDDWASGSHGYVLRTGENGRLSFAIAIASGWQEALSAPLMAAGTWYHVVGTYDGNTLKIYINGIEKGALNAPGSVVSSSYPLNIGRAPYDTTRRFDGLIDDVRLFNRALSTDEIWGLYTEGSGNWVTVENNILSDNVIGLQTRFDGQIFNDFNLLYNYALDYDDQASTGLTQGAHDLVGQNPQFTDPYGNEYYLAPASPAVDAASWASAVPPGGGARADMGCFELLAAPLTVFFGAEDISTVIGSSGAGAVEVGISFVANPDDPITATLPTAWTAVALETPDQTYSYWSTDYTPTQDGLYRFYSRAADVVGNQEADEADWYEGAFVADSVAPTLGWTSRVLAGAGAPDVDVTAPLELRVQVSDYAAGQFSVGDIYFEVDGNRVDAQWAAEPWDSGQPRTFRAWITLANGLHSAQAFAVDKAGNVGQTDLLSLNVTGQTAADATPPALAIVSPSGSGWITHTATFGSTASDDNSGLASVEISLDGGYTWLPASVSGSDWSLEWEGPIGQEFVSFPVWARAADRAGNTTLEARPITVDNVPPTGLEPVTFSAPPGTHFDQPTALVITWTTPEDGSGIADVVLAVDQVTGTFPTSVVTGNTAAEMLSQPGDWYVHIGAKDAAGNQFNLEYGPWRVGTFDDPPTACGDRKQTIIVDGYLDLANGEWRESERLDDDERPHIANSQVETTALYASWDGEAFYVGWQGAWWALDGDLWVYLDTQAGGAASGIETPAGPVILPFLADLALNITSSTEGNLWAYNGAQWAAIGGMEFVQGENGDTEARIPWNIDTISSLNLVAFAVSDDIPSVDESHFWSTFPTNNDLSGALTRFYHWDDLCSVAVINDSQPRADSVLMALSSTQLPGSIWGPNAGLTYRVDLANQETRLVNGLQVELQATPGLSYLTVEGAACADCAAPDHWLLDVPPIDAAVSHVITITAALDSDLTGLSDVSTSASLESGGDVFSQASLSHRVDGETPEVIITSMPGQMLPVGLVTLYGAADDGMGAGIALVQVSTGTTWHDATGLQNWSAEVSVPVGATSFTVWVRAFDQVGLFTVVSATFEVDPNPPSVAASLPQFLTGEAAVIGGTASDGETLVTMVEVQLDWDIAPWLPALVYQPQGGQQQWRYTWQLPSEDGVVHTLRARGYDAVGNLSEPTDWLTTTVDNVAPQTTAIQLIAGADILNYLPGGSGEAVLSGATSDGSGIASLRVLVYDPISNVYQQPVDGDPQAWQFAPHLDELIAGRYTLWVEAVDVAGNTQTSGPFYLFLDQAVSGLQVVGNTPILMGSTTIFTATILAGTNVSYAWDFGDGTTLSSGAPAVVNHVYTATGIYTVTVTAANAAGSVSASKTVQVIGYKVCLPVVVKEAGGR